MDGRKDSQTDSDSYILLNFFFGGGGETSILPKYKISLNQFTQSNYKVAPEI